MSNENSKIDEVLAEAEAEGINPVGLLRGSMVLGTLVSIAWWGFLMFLAVTVGLIPSIIVGVFVAFRLAGLILTAARIEDKIEELEGKSKA